MIENEVLMPVRGQHHADHQQPDLGRRQPKGPAAAPGIGEHSDEILREAGYDEASIRQLRASGAVA
jgi:formyl-CoA transferase